MDTSVQIVEISILRYIPELVAWSIGIVLAVIMVRRGGGKAEKLLLAGCSLMLLSVVVRPFLTALMLWLVAEQGMTRAGAVGLAFSLPVSITGMAGIVCLILAFWARWKTKGSS